MEDSCLVPDERKCFNFDIKNQINLQLLGDKVEIIPSGKTEETGVEGQSNATRRGRGVLDEAVPGEVVSVASEQVDSTSNYDHHKGQHLTQRE